MRPWAAAAALLLVVGACSSGSTSSSLEPAGQSSSGATAPPSSAGASTQALIKQTCADNTHEVLLRTWRGIMPGRSGDLQIISKFPDYIGSGLTHSSPYDYTQEVPFFLYGPGYIKPGTYDKPVTLADLAPTTGALLHFPFDAPDGTAQTEALQPGRPLPKLIVTLVWDSGGMDVLTISRRIGHASAAITLSVYGHWFNNTDARAAEIMEAAFRGVRSE